MKEVTLALVKSGAVARGQADAILARAEAAGLTVHRRAAGQVDRAVWEQFYAEHVGRDYFERLVGSVTGEAGVVAAVLTGDDAVAVWRGVLGATDPEKADKGSVRGDFGTVLPDNAAHGSDSPDNAKREVEIMQKALTGL